MNVPAFARKRQTEATQTARSFQSLIRRLHDAGFGSEFLNAAILPDWWDESCSNELDLLPEIEIRVSRFLAVPLSTVTDPESAMEPKRFIKARGRSAKDAERERLAPAIHAAMQIAGAVVRNLRGPVPAPSLPPSDGLDWRREALALHGGSVLEDILADLWNRGIPVIPAHPLPTPGFQGLAAVIEGRPVIVLGRRHDEPGRVAFRIAHEVGQIANSHCLPHAPLVDAEEESPSSGDLEWLADRYAARAVMGEVNFADSNLAIDCNFGDLARRAAIVGRDNNVDAGAVIFAWARTTGSYPTAVKTTKALSLATGAARVLQEYFARFVDVDGAALSDRELMRVIVPGPPVGVDAASR